MVRVRKVGPEARSRVIPGGAARRAYHLRTPIREAITALRGDDMIELEPDERETLRHVKLVARRAAREASQEVEYGETEQGTLLVWLGQRQRRRRPRRGADQEQPPDLQAPQEELPP